VRWFSGFNAMHLNFQRQQSQILASRLREVRRFIQVVAGPRQVGKTTMVQQVTDRLASEMGLPIRSVSADEPGLRGTDWITQQWDAARVLAKDSAKTGALLVLDEIQKIPNWSETIKRLWDEDTKKKTPLKVVLLGSAPLLIAKGISESLAGRFEILPLSHWSYAEMKAAFKFSLEDFLFFGGYPGAASLISEPQRWARYVADSLIETTLSRDVLLLTRVDKPALLRQTFELACRDSGQMLSYNKMLGQLQDAGNTTTLAHYLELLASAGMVCSLSKYAGDIARTRGSSPKFQVLNTALMTVTSERLTHQSTKEASADREFYGRLVESAVGAHLANSAMRGECKLYYWRDGNNEVDFVAQVGRHLTAIEVKSGRAPRINRGLSEFNAAFKPMRSLIIGGDGISIEEFLLRPAVDWITPH
jgi:uncharacterized protein